MARTGILRRLRPSLGIVDTVRHSGRAVWMLGGKTRRRTLHRWEREEALVLTRAASRIAMLFTADLVPVPFLIKLFGDRFVHDAAESAAGNAYDRLHRDRTSQSASD